MSSSGSSGYGYAASPIFSYTVNNNVAYDPAAAQLIVEVNVGGGGHHRFKAVDLWWTRQVSPPPATPTFNDVPVSDPSFQFIEAGGLWHHRRVQREPAALLPRQSGDPAPDGGLPVEGARAALPELARAASPGSASLQVLPTGA